MKYPALLSMVIFFAIANQSATFAANKDNLAGENIPNSYFVILKSTASFKNKTGQLNSVETVQQAAERLLEQAKSNQFMLKSQGKTKISPEIEMKITQIFGSVRKGFSADLTEEAVQLLRNDPDVEAVFPDIHGETHSTQSAAHWGIDRIDQRSFPLNDLYTTATNGSGVNVYVIDEGIMTQRISNKYSYGPTYFFASSPKSVGRFWFR